MIFNYVKFENYRPYYGIQKVDLYREDHEFTPYKKNITLIGGLNGAGKTSLINAFFICFYGRRMFSEDEYEKIKKEAINRKYLREGGKSSCIELSFSDQTGTYIIKITFNLENKGTVSESRQIYIVQGDNNNREVASAEEEFNDFIDQRIPLDVAPFFIFDAEKIRDLVGEHDKQETINAIQKIVSLELYKQLFEDLKQLKYQDELKMAKVVKDEEITRLVDELKNVTSALELLKAEEKPEEKKIEYLREEKIAYEQKRRLKLARGSQTKEQINRRIGELQKEIELIQTTLNLFGKNSLPKMIVAPLVLKLQARIRKEQSYINAMHKNKLAFAPYDKFINQLFSISVTPPLSNVQINQLRDKGKEIWAEMNRLQQEPVEKINVFHLNALSQDDLQKIMDWKLSSTVDIRAHINKRARLSSELTQLNAQLDNAPTEIDTKEEDERISSISEELGALQSSAKARRIEITKLNDKHHQLQNDLTRKRIAKQDLGPVEQKMELMGRLINATKEFIDQVTILKAQQLKTEIEEILLKLFRKSDLHRVDFDPNLFSLRIFDEFDNEIDLNSRSEGEKQLIALSMIWALTKVSGTSFPFVIDTPLARLDSIHRSNLVNRFFVNLSDQVIILTTDTEITKEFLEEIKPHVQFSYLLEYDDLENSTTIKEGYFEFE